MCFDSNVNMDAEFCNYVWASYFVVIKIHSISKLGKGFSGKRKPIACEESDI